MTATIECPSPNFDERALAIDMVVLHYTGMTSGRDALDRLCDPRASVSAHYLIEEDGEAFALVPETKRAWHAGRASWQGETDVNSRSIGVEIVNPGHEWGYRDFPDPQIDAVVSLLKDIQARRSLAPRLVLGHSDVAPRRKEDPGERFPWDRLAAEGLAVAPYRGAPMDPAQLGYADAAAILTEIGYDAPPGDHMAALIAFQRRFCPASLARGFDPLTKAALAYARDAFAKP